MLRFRPDVTYLERTIRFLYTGLYRVKNGNRQVCAFTAQTVRKRAGVLEKRIVSWLRVGYDEGM